MNNQRVTDINSFSAKAAILTWAVSGATVLVLLPIIVGAMADNLSISAKQLGFLAAADMLGAALGTLIIAPKVHRVNWRIVAVVSILIMVIGNMLSTVFEAFFALLLIRLFTGTGQGVAMGTGCAAMAHTRDPDKLIAIYIVIALLFGAAGLYILPFILDGGNLNAVFISLAIIAALSLICVFWIPVNAHGGQSIHESNAVGCQGDTVRPMFKGLAVLAVLIYFMAQGTIWAYVERMGVAAAISLQDIGAALGVCSLFGAAGGATAIMLGSHYGRLLPLLISAVLSIIGLSILLGDFQFMAYTLAVSLFNFGWNFTYPYQLAAIGFVDSSARLVALSVAMQTLGLAVGPAFVGFFISNNDYAIANWLSGAWILISTLLILPVVFVGDRYIFSKRQKSFITYEV